MAPEVATPMARRTAVQSRADATLAALKAALPEPRCELDFEDTFQLLIATILSAQTTDKQVNRATPALFAKYPTPALLAAAPLADVEALVKTVGFYKTKAKNIRETARLLVERHGGEVPPSMEALVELPGAARKTANVVLGTGFGIPSGITVDTHAHRVSRRLGLTRQDTPVLIERDLMRLFPRDEWIGIGHRLVLHGRYTCIARAPKCDGCPCAAFCPSREAFLKARAKKLSAG